MNAGARVRSVRARFAEDGPHAFIATDPVNVAYLTGFEGVFDREDAHAVVITADQALLFTDSRYGTAATRAAEGSEWEVRVVRENLYITLCNVLADQHITSIALEDSVPHGRFRFISEQFRGHVDAVSQWVEEVRQVKEPAELARIEAAAQLTERAFDHILAHLRPGVTEADVALELEVFMRREGSDGVAFPPIVASGPNSALPHARVTRREIEEGDLVTLDFGARVDGYCADMTRTVVIGAASQRQRDVYEAVLAANRAGVDGVRPGLQGSAIDAVVRAVIEERGFTEHFGHGAGHGVGLEVHELPNVGPRGAKSVRTGSVITIEPGVYVPGFGGVRIEDLMVVMEGGGRVLTGSTRDLLEV